MKKIIGNYQKVSFPEFGINNIVAKIDTGADSGAFHCTKIIETVLKNHKVLHFSPFDHPEIKMETSNYVNKMVKSSNGSTERRFFISTNILIAGTEYPISLSLSDRSTMTYPVLIGSKFLKENSFMVDVGINNT